LRKEQKQKIALAVVPLLGSLFVRFIYLTSKKRFHLPERIPKEPFIYAMWHGNLIMQSFLYHKLRRHPDVRVIISEHFDGQLIARTGEYLGIPSIRGSSSKGGARVLIQAISLLKKGVDIAVTPDGPRGPRHSVADGVVVMAQKTGAKVIPVYCRASRKWEAKSWDRFTLPKPFGTLDFYVGEPIDLTGLDFEAARSLVKMEMMKLVDDE
jgi:lysophospholipid acyltransferase (LPLAT)-like uncharacterized protein